MCALCTAAVVTPALKPNVKAVIEKHVHRMMDIAKKSTSKMSSNYRYLTYSIQKVYLSSGFNHILLLCY